MIEVELPDGSIAEFPDGTSNDVIKGALQKRFGAPQQPVQSPEFQSALGELSAITQNPARAQFDALPAWQKPLVAASDIVQLAANGATFGFGDKAVAGARSFFTDKPYDEELAEQRRLTQGARRRSGGAGTAAEIAGAIAAPTRLAQQGLTLAGRGGTAAMSGIQGLAARSGLMGVEGAGYGALTAAGNDQDIGTGALIGGVAGVGGNVVGEGISAGVDKIAGLFNKKPVIPSADQLSAAKNAAYQNVDNLGVQYSPSAFNDLVKGMTDEVKAANISPMRHPKAASMMMEIQALKDSSPTITQLDQLRQVIRRDVASSPDAAEAFFGKKMIQNIDEFIDAAGPGQVVAGNADDAARAISTARDLNTRVRKLGAVDDAVESARLRAASTGSGGNVDNATRQNLRRVLEKGHFTPDERAAFETAIAGTRGQNALRLAGKLSPQGNGLMAALGIGGTMANPLLGVPALLGVGAKGLADRATSKNVEELVRIISAGGSRAATKAAPNAVQRLAQSKRDAIARLLMGASVNRGLARYNEPSHQRQP